MKLVVIGTGYVGLVAGAGFAQFGHHVTCVDNDPTKVKMLQAGKIPIFEPGLEPLVKAMTTERRLMFSEHLAPSVKDAEVIIIAVGTPDVDGVADLSAVRAVAREIAPAINRENVVVITKSTVPVGTSHEIARIIHQHHKNSFTRSVEVGSNPEFLKEGTAVEDFLRPERVVLGADLDMVHSVMASLYMPAVAAHKLQFMSCRSAELAKYACNAMLATRISFMNEMANLADKCGADINQVRAVMASDSRIGPSFLNAGIGWGGSCFAKDINELQAIGRRYGMGLQIATATDVVNRAQKHLLADRIIRDYHLDQEQQECAPTVAIWGLAFKPNTDDVRDAPALVLIRRLVAAGFQVRATDPLAIDNARKALGRAADSVLFIEDPIAAAKDAQAVVLVTEWSEYTSRTDLVVVSQFMKGRRYFYDGRNAMDPQVVDKAGLYYQGIGGYGRPSRSK